MDGLYLDGIHDLTRTLEDYGADTSTECFEFKLDIWLRITIVIHTALTLVRTLFVQFLRGTGNLLAGVVHLDGERFLMGLNDYLSLFIQAIALLLLGVTTLLLPKVGYSLLLALRSKCDATRQVSDIIYQHEKNTKEAGHALREGLSETIMGILGGLSAFIQAFTLSIESLLTGNFSEVHETLWSTGQLIVTAPIGVCFSPTSEERSKTIFRAHRIALASFNPSALEV